MIKIEGLNFSYRDLTPIFHDFSLEIKAGESWSIIGPSGCGKTTLLFLIAGLAEPCSGRIEVAGKLLKRPRPSTGLVLQDHGLLPWATVYDNTVLGFRIRHYYGPDGKHSPLNTATDPEREKELTSHWLRWLGIDHLAGKYPGQLSRGQRQRAAIARTLVLEPDLLLMDEPFSALDAPIRKDLQRVMNRFHKETGQTSITVTHDIEEAVILGSKILMLKPGLNKRPFIIENKLSGRTDMGKDPGFTETCMRLHKAMGDMR